MDSGRNQDISVGPEASEALEAMAMIEPSAEMISDMRQGNLPNGIDRLLLYIVNPGQEQKHWNVIDVKDIESVPRDIVADKRMPLIQRMNTHALLIGSIASGFQSVHCCIFARVSSHATPAEVNWFMEKRVMKLFNDLVDEGNTNWASYCRVAHCFLEPHFAGYGYLRRAGYNEVIC